VLVLRPIVHEEQQPRSGEALDQPVQKRLRLRVDPVKILEHDEDGLHAALAQQQVADRLQRVLTAKGRLDGGPRGVVDGDMQQLEERGKSGLETLVQREELSNHLLAALSRAVVVSELEVGLQELDNRCIGVALP
jgi:hypothetical protein